MLHGKPTGKNSRNVDEPGMKGMVQGMKGMVQGLKGMVPGMKWIVPVSGLKKAGSLSRGISSEDSRG